jgi:hypothetical protein
MSRRFALAFVLGALIVGGAAVLSRSGSGLALPQARADCKGVGWIAEVRMAAPQAYLRLAGAAKACACPGNKCANIALNQRLFENETMFSGGGKITFKSVVTGVPNLTCIVSRKSQDVIYPQVPTRPNERAVLRIAGGATSCQVEQGRYQTAKDAVFVIRNTKLTVHPRIDAVFGIKAVGKGSLVRCAPGRQPARSRPGPKRQPLVH